MKVTTVGLDLAKQVFSVHGVDEHGKAVLRKRVSRGKLLELFAQLPSSLVGMEACSGAHYWARELERLGHRVGIMAPRFVVRRRFTSPCRNGGVHIEPRKRRAQAARAAFRASLLSNGRTPQLLGIIRSAKADVRQIR